MSRTSGGSSPSRPPMYLDDELPDDAPRARAVAAGHMPTNVALLAGHPLDIARRATSNAHAERLPTDARWGGSHVPVPIYALRVWADRGDAGGGPLARVGRAGAGQEAQDRRHLRLH